MNKETNIKFPFNIGPFVVKNNSFLPTVEEMFKVLSFPKAEKIRYDPHQIISKRR